MPTVSYDTGDLVAEPGIESEPPALGTRNPSYWTTREVPLSALLLAFLCELGIIVIPFHRWGN